MITFSKRGCHLDNDLKLTVGQPKKSEKKRDSRKEIKDNYNNNINNINKKMNKEATEP